MAKARGSPNFSEPLAKWSAVFPWTQTLHTLNNKVFGNQGFREFQLNIMNAVLSGEDVLVLFPTGYGKTLTYQLPGLITQGITIVVEPLISLIDDQISKLNQSKVSCIVINSTQNQQTQDNLYYQLEHDNNLKFLYITPEQLAKSNRLMTIIEKLHALSRIARLVIDEAHCMCQWGRDFRPDYLKLRDFRIKFPLVPILTLTASGTKEIRCEISNHLHLKDPILFTSGFNRPNLIYEVRDKTASVNQDIAHFILNRHPSDSGIIYCNFIKDCEFLSKVLKHNYKLSCGFYHGELQPKKKTEVYDKWMRGELKIIVATLAFGLGIDKQDVRFVVHYSIPESMEIYYQETGRAGRDGNNANCILYYKYEDKARVQSLLKSNRAGDLHKIVEYCENVHECRRRLLLESLGEDASGIECGKMCDNCCSTKEYTSVDVAGFAATLICDIRKGSTAFGTLIQIAEALKGTNNRQQAHLKSLKSYGMLKKWNKKNIERFLRMLVAKSVLHEVMEKLSFGGSYCRLIEGENGNKVVGGRFKLGMMFRSDYLAYDSPEQAGNRACEEVIQDESGKTEVTNQELIDKLKILRRRIAKNERINEQVILRDEVLNVIARDANASTLGVRQEFINEINLYKKNEEIQYNFSVNFDNISFDPFEDLGLKRKIGECNYIPKKVKKE